MVERKVHSNKNMVPLWSSLSEEEKYNYNIKCGKLFDYCESHLGEIVPWRSVNMLLSHIYSFSFERWNETHNSFIQWDDIGIHCDI